MSKNTKIKNSSTLAPLLANFKKEKFKPIKVKRNQDIIRSFFNDYDEVTGIFKIDATRYSVCFSYEDISFSKADYSKQEEIFLKWVKYLSTFSEGTSIQVVNASKPISRNEYDTMFCFSEEQARNKTIAKELNQLIETTTRTTKGLLETKRYIVITQESNSFEDANSNFMDIQETTVKKFAELKSKIHRISANERLEIIYDVFHKNSCDFKDLEALSTKLSEQGLSMIDHLSPTQKISFKDNDYIELEEERFYRVLYISSLPSSITPKFYNRLTTLNDINMITTLNIKPSNPAKTINKITKKISGLDTQRLQKIKRASKNGYSYAEVRDRKLEDELASAEQWRIDFQKNNQRLFMNNMLICLIADSFEELETNTKTVKNLCNEHVRRVSVLKYLQLEALINTLPFGHNNLPIQRGLSSEATAVNVPFNSKDIMHKNGIFYGKNLISGNGVYIDRKKLINGNGARLGVSGGGKSFDIKLEIEQIRLRYPNDEILIVDPQREYWKLINDEGGQTIRIDSKSNTFINPFDMEDNDIKGKIEYMQAWMETILQKEGGLSSNQKTYVDRCTRSIYRKCSEKDETSIPQLEDLYNEFLIQEEDDAKVLATALERYVSGAMDMFNHKTNVDIKNSLVSFDIHEMDASMETTGYLVVLDFIWNRIKANKKKGINTWVYIDEFHILLANEYSASYTAKIYKTARKFGGLPMICTQNITEVLESSYGLKILSNSEFVVMLKQNPAELSILMKLFGVSEDEAEYVLEDVPGQKLVIYGNDVIPCHLEIPRNYHIYDICNTDGMAIAR